MRRGIFTIRRHKIQQGITRHIGIPRVHTQDPALAARLVIIFRDDLSLGKGPCIVLLIDQLIVDMSGPVEGIGKLQFIV